MSVIVDQSAYMLDSATNISSVVAADSFVLTSSAAVETAFVYIAETTNTTEGTIEGFSGVVSWAIYSDDGGAPGTLIQSGTDTDVSKEDTLQNFAGGRDVFKIGIDLGTGVDLKPGKYWLAIREGAWSDDKDPTTIIWLDSANGPNDGQYVQNIPFGANPWLSTGTLDSALILTGNYTPVFSTPGQLFSNENQTSVAKIAATDAENDALTFTITGHGADDGLFSIATDGTLRFNSAPDFEHPNDADNDGVYEVEVQVSDGTSEKTQVFDVRVNNVNEGPVIISDGGKLRASIDVAENSSVVTKVKATSITGSSITYAISGGDDKSLFTIDEKTGNVSFKVVPDYESPQDKNHLGDYQITVRATDSSGAIDVQYITVNVTNISGATIHGSDGADVINGRLTASGEPLPTNEEDRIFGKDGNDKINGLGGNDFIQGDRGMDILKGGAGHDRFNYFELTDSTSSTGIDRIKDFTQGEDVIDVSDIAVESADGFFHFLGEADFDGTAGALRQRIAGENVFLEGDSDGDGTADLVIMLKGAAGLVLTESDVFLGVPFL